MDNEKRLPPDVPRDWDEAKDEAADAADTIATKASNLADKTAEKLRDGYDLAKETISDIDPRETLRDAGRYVQESGEAAVRTVERHPLAAFSLGALTFGLIAWATMRRSSDWEPDTRQIRRAMRDYGSDDVVDAGRSLLDSGRGYLSSAGSYLSNATRNLHLGNASDYVDSGSEYLKSGRALARDGGRILVKRTEREPIAALLGVGLAIYVLSSFLTSESPPPKRRPAKR